MNGVSAEEQVLFTGTLEQTKDCTKEKFNTSHNNINKNEIK